MDALIAKLESCKRALRIAGKLPNPEEKSKYVKRIVGFMYQIRMEINKVARQLESELQ